ncbi:hypothetical protein LDO51_13920 [Providencia alcalifaciens]|uniref:hypothetical protein n=1 Tax=Providencia TaxID=586 RepID=UPI001CE1E698|nr:MULTISPECIES: hypothetical protein [Providencia]UBX48249.1 hypothetical protein LDO51_13920 [Providencia alcalifaciens]
MSKVKTTKIWSDKKIPSINWCRIDRAAHLLNCEVDDILQWAAYRQIELYLYLDDIDCYVSTSNANKSHLLKFIDDSMFASLTTSSFQGNYEWVNNDENNYLNKKSGGEYNDYQQAKEGDSNVRYELMYIENNIKVEAFGVASGLWAINPRIIESFFLLKRNVYVYSADFYCLVGDGVEIELKVDGSHSYNIALELQNKENIFINQSGMERIYDAIGSNIKVKKIEKISSNTRDIEKSHYKIIKAVEDRKLIKKAINKLLAIYPSTPEDKDMCYRTKNGKLIKAKIADILNNHESTLFDSGELPLKDRDTLLEAIGEYLKELGWNSDE